MDDVQARVAAENWWTVDELEAMPTIGVAQTCDLKLDNGSTRVWLSRCGVEDGEPYNNKVSIEVLGSSGWRVIYDYEG